MRYFKLYLFSAGSLTIISLIAQGISALAETSQPAVSSERVAITEAGSTATSATTATAEVSDIRVLEATSSVTTQIVQSAPAAIMLDQTAPMATSVEQVTLVSQLADVQPTDWAFQALQSLVERYGAPLAMAGEPSHATGSAKSGL